MVRLSQNSLIPTYNFKQSTSGRSDRVDLTSFIATAQSSLFMLQNTIMAEHTTSETPNMARLVSSGNPRHHLLTLPQEIQDVIFDLAYPTVLGWKSISRSKWDDKNLQGHRKRNGPFPGSKANDFLVSKMYFRAAAKAYVNNQGFGDFEHPSEYLLYKIPSPLPWQAGIIPAFLSTLSTNTISF